MEISTNVKIGTELEAGGEPRVLEGEPEFASADCTGSQGVRLARLLETARQPFIAAGLDGRIIAANRAFTELTGHSRETLLQRTLFDLTPSPLLALLGKTLDTIRTKGKSLRFEAECLRSDGVAIPVEVSAEPDFDHAHVFVGFFAFVVDMSQRKRTENALRESEERFRRLYDDAPVGYHEVDTQARIVNVNLTECEMLGYEREQVVGRSAFDFVAEDYRELARQAFPDKVSGRTPLSRIERTFLTRDGRRLCIEIDERYKRNERGEIVGLLSTVQDVTARKRAEIALQVSERRARALFEGIEDAVFVHSLDGRILDANPAASRLLGYSRDELVSMTTGQIEDREFSSGYDARLTEQLARGHLACEGRHRTKDGRILPVEINTSTILFDDQKAVLSVVRDISERLALEETRRAFAEARERNAREMAAKNVELTISEARYRQLTEGCLDGVIAADREGWVTLFNPAAEKMFGYQASEIVGQSLSVLMPTAFTPRDHESFEELVEAHEPVLVGRTVELQGLRKGGEEFPLELSLNSVEMAGEVQFIGSIRDQTERHRMRAMLAQSEKLASIGLLSAGVAHEINNPLAYVGNNLAVLERDLSSVLELISLYESSDEVLASNVPETHARIHELAEDFDWNYVKENLPRMLSRTREGVQRVATIVSNLRGLARTSPPKLETVSISDMVESALEMVRGRLRRHHIELIVEHGEVPPLACMPTQISQVLLNLLINAAQAVESANRGDAGKIVFSSQRLASNVVLSVTDNGAGIAPESLPHLFDPFFTTKGVGEGTGLGLSICHGIVTGHGGRIEVESCAGTGSTFRVVLPLKPSGM